MPNSDAFRSVECQKAVEQAIDNLCRQSIWWRIFVRLPALVLLFVVIWFASHAVCVMLIINIILLPEQSVRKLFEFLRGGK